MAEQLFFAQKAFIRHDDRLLLIRKSTKSKYHPGKWEVPGGRLEQGECVADNLPREVWEEVGLKVRVVEPFALWDWFLDLDSENPKHFVAVAMYCEAEDTGVSLDHQVMGDDIEHYQWVKIADFDRFDFIPDMIPVLNTFLQKYSQRFEY